MSNPWFRLYSEFATDPKVQMLSEAYQRRLVMIFCLRSNDSISGLDEEIAFSLRINSDELVKTKEAFIKKGFIDSNWAILNWDKRQFISDNSNSRVAKYRGKRKEMGLSCNGYTKHSVTVKTRDGNCCVYCGSVESLCIDHVLPVNQGGNDDIENLVCACKECNSGKSGRTPEQAGYTFKNNTAKNMWERWIKEKRVTVTVTPPDTDTDTDTDTEQNRTDTEQKKIKSVKKATVIPDDFDLTENSIAYALNKKLNLETELVSFKNFHQAKGSTWKDWQATWRTWCDKAVEFGRSGNGKINGYKSIHDQRAETIAILTGRKNVHRPERDITGESKLIAN